MSQTGNTDPYTVARFTAPDKKANVVIRILPKGDYISIKDFGDKEFKESKDHNLLHYYKNCTTLLDGKPAVKAVYLTTYNPTTFEDTLGYKSMSKV